MRATLRLSRRASYADYLAAEQNSASRHELLDGVVVAMASGSDEHIESPLPVAEIYDNVLELDGTSALR